MPKAAGTLSACVRSHPFLQDMKTNRLIASALAALVAASATVFAAEKVAKTDEKTQIVFSHPEKFADVQDAYNSDAGRDALLNQLADYIKQRAKNYLADGQ